MLLGEAFGRRRDGTRYSLHPIAENSEHFGALKNYSLKEKRLREVLQHLTAKGYLSLERRTKRKSNTSESDMEGYQALYLTPLGRDVLAGEVNLDLGER